MTLENLKKIPCFWIKMVLASFLHLTFLPIYAQTEGQDKLLILITGDMCFGETYQSKLEEEGKTNILKLKGYDYCMDRLSPFLKKANLVIVNLETPVTDFAFSPLEGKYRIHKADIKITPEILKRNNIKVVSLANNHTMDYGVLGLKQTMDILQKNSIDYFGAGMNESEASKPYVYKKSFGKNNFSMTIIGGLHYDKKYDTKYHFYAGKDSLGLKGWTTESVVAQIRALRAADSNTFIVVYPHWLENYKWKSQNQTELAHAIIDAGADILIGHGTHMFQEIEKYKNKWIIYSLGNFMFNSPGRFKKKGAHPYSLVAMMEIMDSKEKLHLQLKLYPILSDNHKTNYQPRPLTKEEMKKAKELILISSPDSEKHKNELKAFKDKTGYYILFDIL